jgi:hypothetical protein
MFAVVRLLILHSASVRTVLLDIQLRSHKKSIFSSSHIHAYILNHFLNFATTSLTILVVRLTGIFGIISI